MTASEVALTIAIPSRNRRVVLLHALGSLRRQTLEPTAFEVVVVDDGSTDGTADAVSALAGTAGWAGRRLRVVRQDWRGAAAARTAALEAAAGSIVLFLDDDIEADPGLAAAHLARHHDDAALAAGLGASTLVVLGRIRVAPRAGAMHREIERWWDSHHERLLASPPTFAAFFTGNVSVPRSAALAAGGFDASLDYGEDVEFGYRIGAAGLRFAYAPEAVVRTRNPKSGAAVYRDQRRVGRGNVRIHRRFPAALPGLPLGGYGETNLRLRAAAAMLLRLGRVAPLRAAIDAWLGAWASSTARTPVDRQLFELARRYAFWSGVRDELADDQAWTRLTSPGAAVLTYHRVRPAGAPDAGPYAIDVGRLARQFRLLRLLRRRVLPLEAILDAWERGDAPPARAVAITFDDGYCDNRDLALPVLRRFGYPATLFAVAGLAGTRSEWDAATPHGSWPLLSLEELRALDHARFRIESHSMTHPDFRALGSGAVGVEAMESRRVLSRALDRPVTVLAYPYGHDDAHAHAAAREAGYRAALTMAGGLNTPATPRFALRRVAISGTDGPLAFALKVLLGRDPRAWLPVPWRGR